MATLTEVFLLALVLLCLVEKIEQVEKAIERLIIWFVLFIIGLLFLGVTQLEIIGAIKYIFYLFI